jgi:hypothetical protein
MNFFLKKLFIFFILLLIPGLVLLALYFCNDPFRVLKHYDTYYADNSIPPNRDYVSTEIFLKQRTKYRYNSFVFGSSRTIALNADVFGRYVGEDAVPFKFDASGEGLYGIYTKLKFLDSEEESIKNVLILLCRDAMSTTENFSNHLVIKHPETSEEGWLEFHWSFLKSYFNIKFLMGYYYFKLTGRENKLTNGIIQLNKISLDYKTNQIKVDVLDAMLKDDSLKYYSDRSGIFYNRLGESYEKENFIKYKELVMLCAIREILERNKSNYKIVLTPLYDEIKYSPSDKSILLRLFGNRLYDFTGENFITEAESNWYETDHFKRYVGDSIMSIIY